MSKPTKFTVLGTLVDRALCMPYAKPQRLHRGWRTYWGKHQATIADEVEEAVSFLRTALTARGARKPWSKAELAVDSAGPWWSKTRDDYLNLSNEDAGWVNDRLAPTANTAARITQQAAEDECWTWLWSQPSFVSPGNSLPAITRPDLVAGLSATACLLIDIKTTSGNLRDVAYSADNFRTWSSNLEALGFTVDESWVLAVSSQRAEAWWLRVK